MLIMALPKFVFLVVPFSDELFVKRKYHIRKIATECQPLLESVLLPSKLVIYVGKHTLTSEKYLTIMKLFCK